MATITRQDAIKEMDTENKMRKRVWRKASQRPVKFLDLKQQRRYEITTQIGRMLELMTDREYQDLLTRMEAADAALDAQKSLF